jgi:hypothetical protein
MSTLSVTSINTANGTTDLTLGTGNTSAGDIVIPSSGGLVLAANSTTNTMVISGANVGIGTASPAATLDVNGPAKVNGSITVSANNITGGGIILSDDGDIVDLNDGFASIRFSNGVKIYSANKSGSGVITLSNTGSATLNSNTLTLGTSSISANGYSRLPNGLLFQWGTSASVAQDSSTTVTFPVAFTTLYSVTFTGRQAINTTSGGSDTVSASNTTTFTIAHGADGTSTFYWMAIGV